MSNNTRTPGGILAGLRQTAQEELGKGEAPAGENNGRRKPSDFWLNVGIVLELPNVETGEMEEVFVSLPNGLALDDMQHVKVRGTNGAWQQLGQTKNALLDSLREACASLEPGERLPVQQLTCEIYRRAEPAQTGDAATNPMIKALFSTLGKKVA